MIYFVLSGMQNITSNRPGCVHCLRSINCKFFCPAGTIRCTD